jgi:SAM-dependent methyltransferase
MYIEHSDPAHIKLEDCFFYHTTDLPGFGTIHGTWDIRGRERIYLGNYDFKGKTVLEFGTGSGLLCRYMEQNGADVTGYDLSIKHGWDIIEHPINDREMEIEQRKRLTEKWNNAWWLNKSLFNLKARIVYGTIYEIPGAMGVFDVVTLQNILQHLENPYQAIRNAANLSRENIIITLTYHDKADYWPTWKDDLGKPILMFNPSMNRNTEHWWSFTPASIEHFLAPFKFEVAYVVLHKQLYNRAPQGAAPDYMEVDHFTTVAKRKI